MLVLSRMPGQSIVNSGDITITVLQGEGTKVRIGIDAPTSISILRSELADRQPQLVGATKPGDGEGI